MATPEDRQAKLAELQTGLDELASIDAESLARTEDLGPAINFRDAVEHFARLLDLMRQLRDRDLSRLPMNHLNALAQAVSQVKQHVEKVKSFSLDEANPKETAQTIVQQVADAYDTVMERLLLPIAFTATQATDYAQIEREAKGSLATIKGEAEKFDAYLEKTKGQISTALAAVREQVAEAGVARNAYYYSEDAGRHAENASRWFWGTVWTAGATLFAAIIAVVVAFRYTPDTVGEAVQYVAAKIIVISVLSFGVLWCSRNYRAEKHNETLNTHRSNALRTFETFVEGTGDARVKDAILLQAANAAFGGRPTGFEGGDTREDGAIHPVVEVLGRSLPSDGGG